MTPAHRSVKILLLQKNMTFADLANRSGLTQTTIHNTLAGRTGSLKAKQAITNALGGRIFDGIRVTERRITLPAGLQIDLDSEAEAIAAEQEFAGFIKRKGVRISFIKPTPAILADADTTNVSAARAARGKRTQHRQTASAS